MVRVVGMDFLARKVSAKAYRQFISRINIGEVPADRAGIALKSREISERVLSEKIPEELGATILEAYKSIIACDCLVAVRSSATAEDLSQASFAGQQDQRLRKRVTYTIERSKRAAIKDLPELISFYQNNDLLQNCETRLDSILRWGTIYFIKDGNEILSCALTTTETDDMAMVGAVFTIEEHRDKGFARDCTINLCGDLLKRGIESYLFYELEDMKLAKMYRKMGFNKTGDWVVAKKRDNGKDA